MKYIFLFLMIFSKLYAGEWESRVDKCGINVEVRRVEGFSIKEFKAKAFMPKAPSEIQKVIDNIEDFSKWHYGVNTAKIVKEISSSERLVYMVLDFPWPVRNRDSVAISRTSLTGGVYLTEINHYQGQYEKTKMVRVPFTKGYWKIEAYKNGSILTYQILGDIGGVVPDFIVNMMLTKSPYNTIKALRKYLKLSECDS